MSIIHMDVDSCRTVQSNLVNIKGQITDQTGQLANMVDGMVGSTWIAPGADQFKGEIQDWRSKMNTILEELQSLSDRLSKEIQQYQDTAQNL